MDGYLDIGSRYGESGKEAAKVKLGYHGDREHTVRVGILILATIGLGIPVANAAVEQLRLQCGGARYCVLHSGLKECGNVDLSVTIDEQNKVGTVRWEGETRDYSLTASESEFVLASRDTQKRVVINRDTGAFRGTDGQEPMRFVYMLQCSQMKGRLF